MDAMTIETLDVSPEFDFFYYAAISNENRFEQDLMEEMQPRWRAWREHLKAYRLTNPKGGASFLLAFLDKPVEDEIEGIWQDSPTFGMAFHNLAITMVMTVARDLVPEVEAQGCAPLPKPGQAAQEAFGAVGLTWNPEGSASRQYAVFTPYPYAGGCEICHLEAECPKRKEMLGQ